MLSALLKHWWHHRLRIKVDIIYKAIYITSIFFRVQFRYGSVWAPSHPSSTFGNIYTASFEGGESLETVEYKIGWTIAWLRFNTTKRSFGPLGFDDSNLPRQSGSLLGVMYFTGAETIYCSQPVVTNLIPRMPLCNPWVVTATPPWDFTYIPW